MSIINKGQTQGSAPTDADFVGAHPCVRPFIIKYLECILECSNYNNYSIYSYNMGMSN